MRLHPFAWVSVFLGVTNSSPIAGPAVASFDDRSGGPPTLRLASARRPDAIVLEGLTKTYVDGTAAVRGISLRVAAGQSFGILAPNGAGKSTTIGMLGTLVRPTSSRAVTVAEASSGAQASALQRPTTNTRRHT